jgi:hypothetical protein
MRPPPLVHRDAVGVLSAHGDSVRGPAMSVDERELLKCSFCGKSQKQVKKLISGPGVYICDECIDLCNEIIAEELSGGEEEREQEPPWTGEGARQVEVTEPVQESEVNVIVPVQPIVDLLRSAGVELSTASVRPEAQVTVSTRPNGPHHHMGSFHSWDGLRGL